MSDDKGKDSEAKTLREDHGIPSPPPTDGDAKGSPTDDRLRSEVPPGKTDESGTGKKGS